MTGLTASRGADGSTVYRGTVASGLIARESGFKEGPGDPGAPVRNAPLDVAVTVDPHGLVRD
jgi:hypothetical protein